MSTPLEATKCCACGRRNFAVLALAVLLAVAATGWVITASDRNRSAAAPVETVKPEAKQPNEPVRPVVPPPAPIVIADRGELVEVWVAARDLPVGTIFTKSELPKLAVKKALPKDGLPPTFVMNEEELFDKRLTHAVYKNEPFNPATVTKAKTLFMPAGMDMVTVPFSSQTAVFVMPGSKVDVLATARIENKFRAFPLLVDVLVLAVDTQLQPGRDSQSTVSFAVTQQQALVLALARQQGCHLEILIRHSNKPGDPLYDISKVMKFLEALTPQEQAKIVPEGPIAPDEGTPVAPAPRSKGE